MKKTILIGLVLALTGAVAATALAASDRGTDKQPIVRIFEDGAPGDLAEMGTAKLIRRDDGLKATAQVSGLEPGGVYTFWWVVVPTGQTFPDRSFVAHGGGKVVGSNGKATVRMNAELGQPSIQGFLLVDCVQDVVFEACFRPLDFDLGTAEVHVEIAYHGQAEAIGDDLDTALGDFWTGTACPDNGGNNPGSDIIGGESNPGQPHCPVSLVAIYPSS